MAIIDKYNHYSDAQALTATAASTDYVDHGADRNLGIGEPLAVVVHVDVALDGTTGDETYSAVLQTDDNTSFSSATTVVALPTMTRGDAAGTRYVAVLPPNTTVERYTRVSYTLGGTTPTGTVTAYLTPLSMIQNNVDYADAITITG
jgi:hypothetical protein